jgi:hypothetical protein
MLLKEVGCPAPPEHILYIYNQANALSEMQFYLCCLGRISNVKGVGKWFPTTPPKDLLKQLALCGPHGEWRVLTPYSHREESLLRRSIDTALGGVCYSWMFLPWSLDSAPVPRWDLYSNYDFRLATSYYYNLAHAGSRVHATDGRVPAARLSLGQGSVPKTRWMDPGLLPAWFRASWGVSKSKSSNLTPDWCAGFLGPGLGQAMVRPA